MRINTGESHQMWWPSPEAVDDLTVEETEKGFKLQAPDGTECACWLSYYSQTEELRKVFEAALVDMLWERLGNLGNENGCTDQIAGEREKYRG